MTGNRKNFWWSLDAGRDRIHVTDPRVRARVQPGLCMPMWQYGVAGGLSGYWDARFPSAVPLQKSSTYQILEAMRRATFNKTTPGAPLSTWAIPMLDIKPPCARCALLLWNPIKLRAPRRTHWSRFANEPQVGDYTRGSADCLFCGWILLVMLHDVRFLESVVWQGSFI